MPELPEVETIKEGLKKPLKGQKILKVYLSNKNLRFPYNAGLRKILSGRTVLNITRRAKYIFFELSGGKTIISHLGMSGSYKVLKNSDTKNYKKHDHDHMIINFKNYKLIYNDPRRFGYILLSSIPPGKHKLIKNLGPEPLSSECNAKNMAIRFYKKERNIKNMLMDQKVIAGLGNIYVCEAMYRAKISPLILAGSLVNNNKTPKHDLVLLFKKIKEILVEAIEKGGSTLKDYAHTDGKMGYFQNSFNVYGREGENCFSGNCNGKIERIIQSNRSTFFCPRCQKKDNKFF